MQAVETSSGLKHAIAERVLSTSPEGQVSSTYISKPNLFLQIFS